MTLTPGMSTALNAPVVTTFVALEITLPTSTIRLIDGSGVVTFGAGTFTGSDPVGGTLSMITGISESLASEAPRLQISLFPPSTGAIADIASPRAQGSRVKVWFGLVNPVNGAVVPSPELLFSGRLDVCTVTEASIGRIIELSVASAFDRLFIAAEGNRLNGTRHKTIWPGETGLDFVTTIKTPLSWGIEAQRQSSTTAPTSNPNPISGAVNGFFGL